MSYKISEVAKMFGVSSEGIRFFEKKDFLSGERTSNGYRTYTNRDIFILGQCLLYSKLGFTLNQAKALFFEENIASASQYFERQIHKKEIALQRETMLLSCLKDRKDALDKAFLNEGRIVIEKVPSLYFCKLSVPRNDSSDLTQQFFHSVIGLIPTAFPGRYYCRNNDGSYETHGENANYVYEKYIRQFDIQLPENAGFIPESVCATYVANISGTSTAECDIPQILLHKLDKEGITPTGDIQAWYLFFSYKKNMEQRYCKLIVPIELKQTV